MRYAILGANGQLGRELSLRLGDEAVPLTRAQADLTSPASLHAALETLTPQVVINGAAYNFVDRAEGEPEAAFAVNAWGVRHLALVCRKLGAALVHFSSDYVFGLDHDRRVPYEEGDAPGPVSVYGLSKLTGEYLVRSLCPRHLVIRTCGLYGVWGSGGKGGNFVETMLRLAIQGGPLRVVNDQTCTPTYAPDLADAVVRMLARGAAGLYHVTSGGACTWFEFAKAILELSGIKADLRPTTSAEAGRPAERPGYSVLASTKLPPLRPWREALPAYLEERTRRTS